MSISRSLQQEVINLIEQFKIRQLCDDYFVDDFYWVVKGSGLLSKTYTDKDTYFNDALGRLGHVTLPGATIKVIDTYIAGNSLILELQGNMQARNGEHYNNQYCWIIKFHRGKIISITAYLDTLLLENILLGNK